MAPTRKRSLPDSSPRPTKATTLSSTKHTIKQSRRHTSRPLPQFLNLPISRLEAKYAELQTHELINIRTRPNSMHSHPISHARDRYSSIKPWSWNTISLPSLSFPYINASRISLGPTRERERFIATQGPLEESQDGYALFWEMVWQEESEVIVMLTRAVEEGQVKCGVYYPVDKRDVKDVEGFGSVRCASKIVHAGTEVRELKIVRQASEVLDVEVPQKQEERTVWHFLFLEWPDHGVPSTNGDVRAFLELIKMTRFKIDERGPGRKDELSARIVHCSAGVGRTGTFIALDFLLQELKDGVWDAFDAATCREKTIPFAERSNEAQGDAQDEDEIEDPIYETVMKLREQRTSMVYQPGQYVFISQVLRKVWDAKYQISNQPAELLEVVEENSVSSNKRRLYLQETEPKLTVGGAL